MAVTATYDPTLSADRDRVRFLVGDVDVSPVADAVFDDEEIDWVLGEQTNIYYAAARLVEQLRAKWGSGKSSFAPGLVEKQVSRLKLKRGADQTLDAAMAAWAKSLRRKAVPVRDSSQQQAGGSE